RGSAPGLHQPGSDPPRRRDVRDHDRAARAARQLAADRRRRALYARAAALRHADRSRHAQRAGSADAHHRPEGLPMMRLLLWVLGGTLLGGIVHLATVLILPTLATQDAYSRLAPIAPGNAVAPLPAPTAEAAAIPFLDPAFAMAVCRYDLTDGPIKLSVPVSPAYTSVSFYTRSEVAYYAINDRAAGRRVIELDLMTSEQRGDLPGDEEVTAADRLIVESPTLTGMILIKALAPEAGMLPAARSALAGARCQLQP